MTVNLTINSLIISKISKSPLFTGNLKLKISKSVFKKQISNFFYTTQLSNLQVRKSIFENYLSAVAKLDQYSFLESTISDGQQCQDNHNCQFEDVTFSNVADTYVLIGINSVIAIRYCTLIGCISNAILFTSKGSLTFSSNCVYDCSLQKGYETDTTTCEINLSAYYNQAAPKDNSANNYIVVRSAQIIADTLNFSNSIDISHIIQHQVIIKIP